MGNIGAILADNAQTIKKTGKGVQANPSGEGFMAMLTAMMGLANTQTGSSTAVDPASLENLDKMQNVAGRDAELFTKGYPLEMINAHNDEMETQHWPDLNQNLLKDLGGNEVTADALKTTQTQKIFVPGLNENNLEANGLNIDLQKINELLNEHKLETGKGLEQSSKSELMSAKAISNAAEHSKQTEKAFGQAEDGLLIQKDDQLPENLFLKNFGEGLSNSNGQPDEITMDAKKMDRDFPEIVISKFRTMTKADGEKELVVQLEPKELGKLVVKLTSIEGTVSVKILAHAPVTRELLETGLGSLRQSFSEQGIKFDRMDIELGGEQQSQSFYEHQQPEQGLWQRSKWLEKSGSYFEPASYFQDELQETVERTSHISTGNYDYLV